MSKIIKAVHDGEEIARLVKKNKISPKRVTATLDYAEGSTNAYTRIVRGESPLGVYELARLAELLKVSPFEIVQDEYRDDIPGVTLKCCASDDEINELMYDYEKSSGGRIVILNAFPSMIYLPKTEARRKRYDLLMGREPGASRISNHEYYPLRAVLRFGFDVFTPFSTAERIEVLDNIVHKAFQADGTKKLRYSVITDYDGFVYSPFAGNCEILGRDTYETLFFTMPFYQYAICIVRSARIADAFARDVEKEAMAHVLKEDETMKMLTVMMTCLKEKRSVLDFVRMLREQASAFYEPVLAVLPDELKQGAGGKR